jgi:hypothetical protein
MKLRRQTSKGEANLGNELSGELFERFENAQTLQALVKMGRGKLKAIPANM